MRHHTFNPVEIGKQTWNRFSDARAAGRGAAIAFYTVTAIVPVLLIVIAVTGAFFGRDMAGTAIFTQFEGLIGDTGANVLRKAVDAASGETTGIIATIIGVITLLLTASGVFLELEEALNAIWEAKPRENLATFARARAMSFGLVIAFGFLLVVSLAADAALAALGTLFASSLAAVVLLIASQVMTFALMTIVFAGVMRYLPKKRIAWSQALPGAGVTAALFMVGKLLIGLYLGNNAAVKQLGEAGALLALLFWVYYSAQIFLFGASFTRVFAEAHAGKKPARRHAVAKAPSQKHARTA